MAVSGKKWPSNIPSVGSQDLEMKVLMELFIRLGL
jgi:hypothetical protein